MRHTTVELIIDARPAQKHKSLESTVRVVIAWEEVELREQAKAHGAWWDSLSRTWTLSLRAARKLKLLGRAIDSDERAHLSGKANGKPER